MTFLRRYAGLIVILAALLLAADCTTAPAANTSHNATASAVPGPTVLHALVDETGANAVLDEPAAALALVERDLNDHYAKIGSDHRVRIVVEDVGSDSARALDRLRALDAAGVRLVIGLVTSEELRALKPYADEHGMLLVVTGSTAAKLSTDDQVLRFCPSDRQQAAALAQYLHGEGISHLVPIRRGDVWGDGLVNETRAAFGNGTIASGVRYDPATTYFAGSAARLDVDVGAAIAEHGANATGVYAVTFREVAPLMEASRAMPNLSCVRWFGADGNALVPDLATGPAAAFAEATRFIAPAMGTDEPDDIASRKVPDTLRAVLNRTPDAQALALYDVAWIASLVADQGTGENAEALKDAFVATANRFTGVSGDCVLNAEGDRRVAVYSFWSVRNLEGTPRWVKDGWAAEWFAGTFTFLPLDPASSRP